MMTQQSIEGSRLSPQQQHLWRLQERDGERTYRAQCAVKLNGPLAVRRLERALREVVERHEILRTSFRWLSGMSLPLQVVEGGELSWEEAVVSGSEAQQWEEVWRQYEEFGEEAGAAKQVLRVRLLKLGPDRHVLLVRLAALCGDAATLRNLVRELSRAYGASSNGEIEVLQYADLAEWQNELLEAEETVAGREYWQRETGASLAGPALGGYECETAEFKPEREVLQSRFEDEKQIARLAAQAGVSAEEVLLSCWTALMWRLREQVEIVVATAFDGRADDALQDALGPFVKYLPVRVSLDEDLKFNELLERINQGVTENSQWQESFSWQQIISDDEESVEENLYPVAFEYEEWNERQKAGDVTFTITEPYVCAERYTIKLSCHHLPDGLRLELHYNSDTLTKQDVQRLGEEYVQVLSSALARPEATLAELEMVGPGERQQLLVEWNQTSREYPRETRVHELFEQQAASKPKAVAVLTAKKGVSYGELNSRANRLAFYLRRQGVGPDSFVGVMMERGVDMIVALLGVLKAGGAYVPLDPQYPLERLSFMLNDAGVSVLLTQSWLVGNVPTQGLNVIFLDDEPEDINLESDKNPERVGAAENLAYVIYTLGSTGQPKGVLITHENLIHSTAARKNYYSEPIENYLLLSSFAFDSSVAGIFWTLAEGGTLSLPGDNAHQNPSELAEWIKRNQVSHTLALPSLYSLILAVGDSRDLKSLGTVIVAGEACPRDLVERHSRILPEASLYNEYGPTEGTVWSSVFDCLMEPRHSVVPIGRPISNTRLYILDQHLKLVPVGVAGELYVSGEGLARGYLNRPELTAEKFIPNAFSEESGTRLYRTGDLTRYLPDGNIEFLGRIDNQVKIRGYRIEMGEIESALSEHPAVCECVVLVREDEPGDKRLVAYVTLNGQPALTVTEFRDFLKATLPEYMMPAAFVTLDAMPLTPNGKVDRRSLPAPDRARPKLAREFVAPRTAEEQALAAIWEQVLGVEQVGIYDNFFELGGDSIRSVQVRASAQNSGINFSVQQLFKHQTIYDLLTSLAEEESEVIAPPYEPLSLLTNDDLAKLPGDVEDAYPIAKLQLGMLFHSGFSSTTAAYHDITSVHLHAPLDLDMLETALDQLSMNHPMLRTSFDLTNLSEPLQLVHRTVRLPLTVDDLRHLSEAEQEAALESWIEAEKGRRFDWSRPPLLRFHIHRRTDDSYQFSLSLHHAILDGWSVASMLTELYQQYFYLLGDDVEAMKPPPASTYGDFVALERASLDSEEHRQYWTSQLSDSTTTKLPRSQHGPEASRLHTEVVPISPELSMSLKRFARLAGVPLKSVLLAAHLRVLSLISGHNDVVSGLVSHGRPEEADGERVLGLFLNTLPFRLNLRGGTWIDLAREVFRAEREMLPYRRYPLAELQRMAGGQPLFEVAFNFIHFHVYQTVQRFKRMEVLDGKFFEETNLPLMAHFSLDLVTSAVQLRLDFNGAGISGTQIDAIAGYYAKALSTIADEAENNYESASLLSEAEQQKLLFEWNATQRDYPPRISIQQLIERQVERTPEAVALIFGDQRLTYRELNERANQLAHYLRALNVGPEALVGVLMERSVEMVVALLGIMKAGGAYVPLDPQYPQERVAFMLEDADLSCAANPGAYGSLSTSTLSTCCPS